MDTDGRFPTPTTRRTIVATGAKLAYAAPLVATSLKLSAMNVAATHISPGHTCPGDIEIECGGSPGHGGTCSAVCTTENELFCLENLRLLGTSCTSDANCGEGFCEPFDELGSVCVAQPCDSTADCNCVVSLDCKCWATREFGTTRRGICRRGCGTGVP